jgi:hypothetical protein
MNSAGLEHREGAREKDGLDLRLRSVNQGDIPSLVNKAEESRCSSRSMYKSEAGPIHR